MNDIEQVSVGGTLVAQVRCHSCPHVWCTPVGRWEGPNEIGARAPGRCPACDGPMAFMPTDDPIQFGIDWRATEPSASRAKWQREEVTGG